MFEWIWMNVCSQGMCLRRHWLQIINHPWDISTGVKNVSNSPSLPYSVCFCVLICGILTNSNETLTWPESSELLYNNNQPKNTYQLSSISDHTHTHIHANFIISLTASDWRDGWIRYTCIVWQWGGPQWAQYCMQSAWML